MRGYIYVQEMIYINIWQLFSYMLIFEKIPILGTIQIAFDRLTSSLDTISWHLFINFSSAACCLIAPESLNRIAFSLALSAFFSL